MKKQTIGIIGGSGKCGIHVVDYLLRHTSCRLLIGGRNPEKAKQIAIRSEERINVCKLDVFDIVSLNLFCKQCHIVVNLAGPTLEILDKVALACLSNCCHYVDIGGYDLLIDALSKRRGEIEQKQLIFAVGAGWMPGISGVFPKFFVNQAQNKMDTINKVNIYYGASEAWSFNACLDLTWSLSLDSCGLFQHGEWTSLSAMKYTSKRYFPFLGKTMRIVPYFDNQLKTFAHDIAIPHFGNYVIINSNLTMMVSLFIKGFLMKKTQLAAKLMQKEARYTARNGAWGLITCTADGVKDNKPMHLNASICETDNYRPNGVSAGITATLITQNRLKYGLGYLSENVSPSTFMNALIAEKISLSYE